MWAYFFALQKKLVIASVAKQSSVQVFTYLNGLPRRFAPRNDLKQRKIVDFSNPCEKNIGIFYAKTSECNSFRRIIIFY